LVLRMKVAAKKIPKVSALLSLLYLLYKPH
jgi:hypothetical protein